MPAAVTSLISGFSSRLWGYSLISGQSSRIWGILAFSKHTGNWRFYTLLVMFRRCVDPGYFNVRETASQKVAKSGLIRRMEPRIDEAQAVAAAVAKASCPSLALAEMVKRLWLMPPQFQWTGIGWMASDWHCAKGRG